MNRLTLERNKIYQGNLLLVNGSYPLAGGGEMEKDLTPADIRFPDILMRHDAAVALQNIFEKIGSKDNIVPVSGYRSKTEQTVIYEESLKENGEEFTGKYVALPGHSEHQSGLAIDLGLNQEKIDFICPDFPYEGICEAFRKAAPDYGFIERYTGDKEEITGISKEPWHFRYVGFPHSRIMEERGMSLEEYVGFLKSCKEDKRLIYPFADRMEIQIYYVPAKEGKTLITMQETEFYQISGNNFDGFIVTVWRRRE